MYPSLPTVTSIRGFAHAASLAAARRCLWLLVLMLFAFVVLGLVFSVLWQEIG